MKTIHTDSNGKPFARPELRPDATIEDKIDYMRAVHAYNDAIANRANAAFDTAFRKAVRS